MVDARKVFSAVDAAPMVLFAKEEPDEQKAFPVTPGMMSGSMTLPDYDKLVIDLADASNILLTYKKDGASVATKLVNIDGTTITITKT